MGYTEDIVKALEDVPNPMKVTVLMDINNRVTDWMGTGGKEDDPYIQQQVRYAENIGKSFGVRDVKTRAIYDLYKYDKLVGTGTVYDVVKWTGFELNYVRALPMKGHKIWRMVRANKTLPIGGVNIGLLRQKIKEFDYYQYEIAEHLGIKKSMLSSRLNGRASFRPSEVVELEGLFFLDEGELLSEQNSSRL